MAFRLEDTEVYDTCGKTDRPYVAQPVFLWVKTFSRARQTLFFSNSFPLENKNQVSVGWVACLVFLLAQK